MGGLKERGMPGQEKWSHGVRARYIAGCRCSLCRKANADYCKERARANRAGNRNGLVDASEARAHLKKLSEQGIGYKTVADAAGTAVSVVHKICTGERTQIRMSTESKILDVDDLARADGALISAGQTWRLLNKLLSEGYTKAYLGERLGSKSKTPSLQVQLIMVKAGTAQKVRKLHAELMAGADEDDELSYHCNECGLSHRKRDRLKHLKAMLRLPRTKTQLQQAWPCAYGVKIRSKGERSLYRDLKSVRAQSTDKFNTEGIWSLPRTGEKK